MLVAIYRSFLPVLARKHGTLCVYRTIGILFDNFNRARWQASSAITLMVNGDEIVACVNLSLRRAIVAFL